MMIQESKNRILLVEDDADTRSALAMLFEMEGFDVMTAGDGEEAYDQAVNERPDLIVTDINMPKVDGLSLIKMIREDGRTDGIPIVAVSAIDKQHLNQAKELGAVAVAQKPIEFDQFLSLIAKVATARSKRNRIERGRNLRYSQ
jgi:two-component system chemotaxis response regulator CheY